MKSMSVRSGQNGGRKHVEHIQGGTPELKARREFLAQKDREAKTTYPLGCMLVCEIIKEGQQDAGCKYAFLYAERFGPVSLRGSMEAILNDRIKGHWNGDRLLGYPEELQNAKTELMRLGLRTTHIIENLCVFMNAPAWCMKPHRPNLENVREGTAIDAGLTVLADHFFS